MQSGLGVVSGLERGGTAGYGSALASGSPLLSGALGTTASDSLGAVGNLASGNYVGAVKDAYGAYTGATAQAGLSTTQAAAESAAAQAGGGAGAAASGGAVNAAGNAVGGALTAAVPIFLATQLASGLVNSSSDPGALAQRTAWSTESNLNASLEGWLGTNGTPALQGVSGDGSSKYPITYTLKDGTQLSGSSWNTLVGMYSRMDNPYNTGAQVTPQQIQQFLSSQPKSLTATAAPTAAQTEAAQANAQAVAAAQAEAQAARVAAAPALYSRG